MPRMAFLHFCLVLCLAVFMEAGLCQEGQAAASAREGKLRVVTRPPVRHTPGASVQSRPAPTPKAEAEDSVAVYRKFGEDGTVYLTNRPDGDAAYRFFGHFRALRLMETLGPEGVRTLAERYAARYGVDARMILAIIHTESGFDSTAVSPAGARGLMQLMPGTQQDLGVSDAFNPSENVEGGVRYFRAMLDRYNGNIALALAAYNAGPANVDKYGGVPPFEETQRYVRKVMQRAGK